MFILPPASAQPMYVQLYTQIRDDILSGKLPENTKLPSIRELAGNLSISKNTIEYAYNQLSAEGYIESRPRSGYFVSVLDLAFIPALPQPSTPPPADDPIIRQHACEIDFQPIALAPDSFPFSLWQKLYSECVKEQKSRPQSHADPQGELNLRLEIQKYLAKFRGVVSTPDQIVITSGLQHSLSILSVILRDDFAACAMEDPGFFIARTAFQNHSFAIKPIPVHADGIDIKALEHSKSRIVYVTPSHQFPLGYIMPIATRAKLLDWAEKNNGIIIEDDYDSELRYSGKPILSLQGLSNQGNVAYLGTFSKALSPFPRVSYIVLPDKLLNLYQVKFMHFPSSVPLFDQLVLQKFMAHGHWERHLRKLRTAYKTKYDILVKTIRTCFGEKATILGSPAGLHIVLKIPGRQERDLIEAACRYQVKIQPVSVYYRAPEVGHDLVLLGFGGLTPDQIIRGVELLNQAWFGKKTAK